MPHYTVADFTVEGPEITRHHFGGNIINTANTNDGRPEDTFVEAISELGISNLRYPAGQPDVVYSNGLLVDDDLPQHLYDFMDWAQENSISVVIVTPTFDSYRGSDELQHFAELLLTLYPEQIRAFEIGNEYWQHQTETEYGQIANEAVTAINLAIQNTGVDTDVLVQMANAAGAETEFGPDSPLGWVARTEAANHAILAQLNEDTLSIIDGAVEHYYFRDQGITIGPIGSATTEIGRDYDTWQNATVQDLDLAITEWNIRSANIEQLGVRAASTILQQFSYMLEMGVDEAYVWPPQHNISNDLAGNGTVLLSEDGSVVLNSVGGAMFDLLATHLPGKQVVDLGLQQAEGVNVFSYASDRELSVFVTSRSTDIETVSFNVGDLFPTVTLDDARILGYDQTSSNGMHWVSQVGGWRPAEAVLVNGQDYFLNEHDVRAQVTNVQTPALALDTPIIAALLPFEVLFLNFDLDGYQGHIGTVEADNLVLNSAGHSIRLLAGDDTLRLGGGDDTVYAGLGDDNIISGPGADIVFGNNGQDYVSAWGGDDTISGGFGDDTLLGFQGDDVISGDEGNDILRGYSGDDNLNGGKGRDTVEGGDGNDIIEGYTGSDVLMGQAGNDRILSHAGADTLSGGDGLDTINGGRAADVLYGDADDDRLHGGPGDDVLLGGTGNDTLSGGSGADNLTGGSGFDFAHYYKNDGWVFASLQDSSLNDGAAAGDIFTGIEGLIGGGADDVLMGDQGGNALFGQDGDDVLHGAGGDDILKGGLGVDEFIFTFEGGNDTIRDFENNVDIIDISTFFFNSLEAVANASTESEGDVRLQLDSSSSVTVENTSLAEVLDDLLY